MNLTWDRFAAPENEIRNGRLACRSLDQHGDLAAVIPRMPKQLSQDVFHAVAEPASIQALVFKGPDNVRLGELGKIFRPQTLDFLPLDYDGRQFSAFGEQRGRENGGGAEPTRMPVPPFRS